MHAEKMIGFLILHKKQREKEPESGEIWGIYLEEEYRGKGYGKKVLYFAVNRLKDKGAEEIFLWIFEENNRSRQFYEKHGFMFDETKRKVYYGKDLWQLRYRLRWQEE